MGVPTLGCECAVCRDAVSPTGDPRNRRTRPSVLALLGRATTSSSTPAPTSTREAIRAGLRRVDAVLYTHGHADHVLGMDDLRPLSFHLPGGLPLYAGRPHRDYHRARLRLHLPHARTLPHQRPRRPESAVVRASARWSNFFRRALPAHPRHPWPPDHHRLPLWLSGVPHRPQRHPCRKRSAARRPGRADHRCPAPRAAPDPLASRQLHRARRAVETAPGAFFTHMSHDLEHAATDATLPPHIRLAYDGLQINFEIA